MGLSEYVQTGSMICALLVYVGRRRLSVSIKSAFLAGVWLVLAFQGLWTYGAAGTGMSYLIVFVLLATFFFGLRGGLVAGALALIEVSVCLAAVLTGRVSFSSIDLNAYAKDPTVWIGLVLMTIVLATVVVFIAVRLYRALLEALRSSHTRLAELQTMTAERVEQAAEARALADASAAVATTLEPQQLCDIILEHMTRVVPCDMAVILAYDQGWAVVMSSRGEPRMEPGTRVAGVSSGAWYFPQSGDAAQLAGDLRDDPDRLPPPWTGEHEMRSVIVLPLVMRSTVYGCLSIGSLAPHALTERHVPLAVGFGERVAQALWNAHLYRLEQERARAAEQLAFLKGEFVTTVSHELRTPLAAVLGYAELLDGRWDDLDDARRRSHVKRIVSGAIRQQQLIENLLHLDRLDTTAVLLSCEPVPVDAILTQAIEDLRDSYPGQRVACDVEDGLVVVADAAHARQIVGNLLDNAAKYSDEGSPITLNATREDRAIAIRVRDFGRGIPEASRPLLFTRFGRLPGSRIRAGRVGTGLGLYLSREFAAAMGGSLDLETTGPNGSVFCLHLPCSAEQPGVAVRQVG